MTWGLRRQALCCRPYGGDSRESGAGPRRGFRRLLVLGSASRVRHRLLNVSQFLMSPESKSARNHLARWSEEPWVQVSGFTWPVACFWMRSSPTAAVARRPSSSSPGSRMLCCLAVCSPRRRPDSRLEAPGSRRACWRSCDYCRHPTESSPCPRRAFGHRIFRRRTLWA
jgi:hypothetical protein